MAEFKYEVTGEYGVVSDNGKGTVTKLRTISWNDRPEKFDIRSWYTAKDGSEGMNKGITLTKEELLTLGDLIDEIRKADEKPKATTKSKSATKTTTKAKSVACSATTRTRTTKATAKTSTNTTKSKAKAKTTGKGGRK